jgi:hypothetical protein
MVNCETLEAKWLEGWEIEGKISLFSFPKYLFLILKYLKNYLNFYINILFSNILISLFLQEIKNEIFKQKGKTNFLQKNIYENFSLNLKMKILGKI